MDNLIRSKDSPPNLQNAANIEASVGFGFSNLDINRQFGITYRIKILQSTEVLIKSQFIQNNFQVFTTTEKI